MVIGALGPAVTSWAMVESDTVAGCTSWIRFDGRYVTIGSLLNGSRV